MIITYRNFSLSSFVITSWWWLHTSTFPLLPLYKTSWWSLYTATFELPPLLKVCDDHYIPQLFSFLLCYNFMMVIIYRNFFLFSFVITSWWSLHTSTFLLLPLYKTSWWSLYTATFELSPLLKLHDDHYIPQLLHFLLCYNFMMIIIYRNFSLSSFVITSWWSLHTATFPLPPLL